MAKSPWSRLRDPTGLERFRIALNKAPWPHTTCYVAQMSYPLSSRHVFVRSGTSQVFVRLPGGWSDDARVLDDAQHAAEGWVHVRPVVPNPPATKEPHGESGRGSYPQNRG